MTYKLVDKGFALPSEFYYFEEKIWESNEASWHLLVAYGDCMI